MVILGISLGLTFAVVYLSSYFYYDYLHRSSHYNPPKTAYGRYVRKHHFAHHFSNPKHNFGVTTVFWDKAFGTYHPVEVVRVPEKRAMGWLFVEDTKELRSEFVGDYCIVRRKKRKVSSL